MTNDDAVAFSHAMVKLGEIYNEPISAGRIAAYFEALADLPSHVVVTAMQRAGRQLKFFPKPAELRELATGNDEERAARAWSTVLREIRRVGWIGVPRFDDPVILPTIERVFGSWQALCETLPAPGVFGFEASAKSFAKHYVVADTDRLQLASAPLRVIDGGRS